MKAFDRQLRKKAYIPMAGQIIDASLVPAPKQRNTEDEKEAVKAPKVQYRPDGTPLPMIAVPMFGCKSYISIDRKFGFIHKRAVTSASAADGHMLRCLVTPANPPGHHVEAAGKAASTGAAMPITRTRRENRR